ncbi:FAD-dependent oxidoreductase [Nisaea acidiphila]|uniref:FAD-dependent oxidoreductase n=1 Tax=Nisaea acidiphila TaxID=1862145 RepID=A0A9J7AVU0_9PROT|nr:FAD-dependent oxidoreductase [Nisaea acidiphila]UUX50577.1 FAD-dependent oxidoreductase [Nisaea acidiphila]
MIRTDLAIIGAGPAGMSAAVAAREAGLDVIVVDEQPAAGGQIWRAIERNARLRPGNLAFLGEDYVKGAELAARFAASGAQHWPGSTVWHVESPEDGDKTVTLAWDGATRQVRCGALLIASGAMERPVPVPGWTLPGVMTVGAAQTVLKSSGLFPEAPLLLAGSGPLLLLFAAQCLAAGIEIAAVLDTTPAGARLRGLPHLPKALLGWRTLLKGRRLMRTLSRSGVRIYREVTKIEALGAEHLERVRFQSVGGPAELETASLLLHEGVVPNPQLTRLLRCEHRWDRAQRCFRPELSDRGETSVENVFVAGDGGGIGGAMAAVHAGRIAALEVAERFGAVNRPNGDVEIVKARDALRAELAVRPLLDAMFPPPRWIGELDGGEVICRCEEVTAADVRKAAALGAPGPNQAKAFLRAGMGPCQGRMCGLTVTEILADAHGKHPEEIGYYRIRPPIKPVTLGELAALDGAD